MDSTDISAIGILSQIYISLIHIHLAHNLQTVLLSAAASGIGLTQTVKNGEFYFLIKVSHKLNKLSSFLGVFVCGHNWK